MDSPQPDAPIPLVPVDNAPSYPPHRLHESPLKREEDVVPTRHGEGEDNGEGDNDPPQYPPPPRTPRSSSARGKGRRVRHTRTGSTRAVPGFGTRSRASTRHALYLLLERPTSSHSAFVLHLVTNVVIVLRFVVPPPPSPHAYPITYKRSHYIPPSPRAYPIAYKADHTLGNSSQRPPHSPRNTPPLPHRKRRSLVRSRNSRSSPLHSRIRRAELCMGVWRT
jgi:hypothetical protein